MGVAAYLRISQDKLGLETGVQRQEEDCLALALRKGWEVAYIATDNDVSAYKRKPRPEFERILADLKTGLIDGVIVYDIDRLARRPIDLERLIDLYDTRPLRFGTVTTEIDLSTPDGRFIARIMVNVANKSSADTARRVTRTHLQMAQKGVPVGGHRPFGYKADKITIEPSEAKLIRQAAQDVLTGVGLNTICRRWNEAGIKTTAGNHWRHQVLRHMLLSPRLAGYRVYRGGIAKDAQGNPVVGLYKPILDVQTWESVGAVLTDPNRQQKASRRYLLSGIVRCASCGQSLYGNAQKQWGFIYHCSNNICPKQVTVTGKHVDSMITDLVKAYLAERTVEPSRNWDGEGELEEVVRRIAELMNAYGDQQLSAEVVFPQVTKLEDRATRLRGDKAAWLREQVRLPISATESWPEEVDRQRAVIQSLILAVVVKPATRMGNSFDASRVEPPVWKQPLPKPRQSKAGRKPVAS